MMQILAPVDNIRFDIEDALDRQTFPIIPLPFPGMDKSASAVCELFAKSSCDKGMFCPFRHVKGDKSVVCKHWLRGLCKKGDECEFLHEYDMSKMPECFFYSKYSQCGNKECEFLHLDRESKIKDCPWYDRGFCRHGPNCKNRHVKKVICQNYLFGFCPEGPNCKFKHPKFELPIIDPNTMQKKQLFVCDYCGEKGHKVASCFKLNPEFRQNFQAKRESAMQEMGSSMMNISDQLNNEANKSIADEDTTNDKNENSSSQDKSQNEGQKENTGKPGGMNGQFHQQGFNQNRSGFHGMHHNNHHHPNHHHHHHHPHFHHNFQQFSNNSNTNSSNHHFPNERFQVPPSEVTCFKCGEKGHYANKCNKGAYAFLRGSSDNVDKS